MHFEIAISREKAVALANKLGLNESTKGAKEKT
jgi:hypothetical protein